MSELEAHSRGTRIREHVRDYSTQLDGVFSTSVYGKCILAGEHAVLRGTPALVVPLKSRALDLTYTPYTNPEDSSLRIESLDELSEPTKLVLWGVIEKALTQVGKSFQDLNGVVQVKNAVPFGAGLGASAALCVSVARLFKHLGWIKAASVVEFARLLENIFHGESSGVDVAVAESGRAIQFTRGVGSGNVENTIQDLDIKWKPNLYLSFSGRKGVTSECVKMVQELIKKQKDLGSEIDVKMAKSVLLMKTALTDDISDNLRLEKCIESMNLALECFEMWGLTKGYLSEHIKTLNSHGALALKPTGSGGGGHVLSLWKETPPSIDGLEFIKLEL